MRFLLILCLCCTGCGVVQSVGDWFSGQKHCDKDNGGCDRNATCQQQQKDEPVCTCHASYRGDGKSCQPNPAEPAVTLVSGEDFTCALAPEGTLRCWGNLASPWASAGAEWQIRPTAIRVGEEQEWLAISALGYMFCGIRKTGTVSCWYGVRETPSPMPQSDPPMPDGTKFVSVSAGSRESCAINESGELWCWTHGPYDLAVQVPSSAPWSAVSAGLDTTCALRNDNTLWCWKAVDGWRFGSQPRNPVEVAPGRHWSSLSTGDGPTCAVDDQGTLSCLSVDQASGELRLQQVSEDVGWTRVASGSDHLCALKNNGTVWCRGMNARGEVTGEMTAGWFDSFVQVKSSSTFESVSIGQNHSCAATAAGDVWCWGDDHVGQLGDDFGVSLPAVRKVPLTTPAVQVSAGDDASCAVDSSNALWCWGWNLDGGVGDGTSLIRPQPVPIGTAPWRSVHVTEGTTSGIQQDGSMWTWGRGQWDPFDTDDTHDWLDASRGDALEAGGVIWREVGTGSSSSQLDGLWKQFAKAHSHLCGIQENDSLWCVGEGLHGALGIKVTIYPDTDVLVPVSRGSTWSAIAVSEGRSCGIQSDGTLLCWGRTVLHATDDTFLPTAVPGTESFHWKSVAVGYSHVCALREDGTLWCWGDNSAGQLGTHESPGGSDTPLQVGQDNDWSAISSGAVHTCGLRNDGSVWCWGRNQYDVLGDTSNGRPMPVPVVMR